jgi:branched-subunit amino acid aminotransferase/4-amino-4-deoxychorismate lyase
VLEQSLLVDAYVRITLTRGRAVAPLAAPGGPATAIVAALPAPSRRDAPGIAAALIGPPADQAPRAKSTSRQLSLRAQAGVRLVGAEEGIHVSEDGRVLEGVSSNVFIVRESTLSTPPISQCLPGITRGRLLELARGAGIECDETPIDQACLFDASEVFVTNAVQGPRAIRSIDGTPVKGWRQGGGGRMFAQLLDLYDRDRLLA